MTLKQFQALRVDDQYMYWSSVDKAWFGPWIITHKDDHTMRTTDGQNNGETTYVHYYNYRHMVKLPNPSTL